MAISRSAARCRSWNFCRRRPAEGRGIGAKTSAVIVPAGHSPPAGEGSLGTDEGFARWAEWLIFRSLLPKLPHPHSSSRASRHPSSGARAPPSPAGGEGQDGYIGALWKVEARFTSVAIPPMSRARNPPTADHHHARRGRGPCRERQAVHGTAEEASLTSRLRRAASRN